MTDTYTLLLLGGLLLGFSLLLVAISSRAGFPLLLVFLGVGMLAGEDGLGGIRFDDFQLSFLVGNLALAIILLDGGLRTSLATFRVALAPAATLASWGVAATAGMLAVFAAWLLDVDWRYGLLLGAIVGSTDAAAVFAQLRYGGVRLNERMRATLEIESGANDPMAVFLVVAMLDVLLQPAAATLPKLALSLAQQLGLGAVAGLFGGWVLTHLLRRLQLAEGLYALLIASGGVAVFAATNQLGGSGFLAIYLTGLYIGNQRSRAVEHVLNVMDGLAWLAQAGMFLILGLLVTPSQLLDHPWQALGIALFLMLVARPLAVISSLLPFRFKAREIAFISWVGLRGAVPIVLAVFPVMAGLPDSLLLFDVTFAVVLFSLLVQGSSTAGAARLLRVLVPHRAEPVERRELWIGEQHSLELLSFRVEPHSAAVGRTASPRWQLGGDLEVQCVLLLRGGQEYFPDENLHCESDDVVWLIATSGDARRLAPLFSAEAPKDQLAASAFFGEFVLEAASSAADLAALYGLELSEAERAGTVADLLEHRLGRRAAEGDGVAVGAVQLTVRDTEHGRITRIGLKLGHGPSDPSGI